MSETSTPKLTPTDKVSDFSIGFHNVKEASANALYNLKDDESGVVTPNALCLDMVPRYVYSGSKECIPRVNPATSLGDIIASVIYLSSRLEVLELEVGSIKKKQEVYEAKTKLDQDELDHMGQHISALETNLRCLRETLTYGELEEDDLPELESCPLTNGTVKKRVEAIETTDDK